MMWGTALPAGRSRVLFLMRLLEFFNHCGPEVDTASLTKMSIRGIFWGVKAASA